MQVYKVLTKYNILREMELNPVQDKESYFNNRFLLLMDSRDLDSVFDEDVRGISVNVTDDITVNSVNYSPFDMNTTYEQIIQNPTKNPVFTFNNTSITMYPSISAMIIKVGPIKICIDINEAEGDVLFTSLIRMINDAKIKQIKQVGRELMGTKRLVNSGTLNRNASSIVGSFLSGVNRKSLKQQIGIQKDKLQRGRKTRKSRKN